MKSARLALVALVLAGAVLACGRSAGPSDLDLLSDYLEAQTALMDEATAMGLPGDGPDSWTVDTQLIAQNLAQRSMTLPATPVCMAEFRQACDDAWFYQVLAIESWVTFEDPGLLLAAMDLLVDAMDRQTALLDRVVADCR